MKKILQLFLVLFLTQVVSTSLIGQVRYYDKIFTDVQVTEGVQYGTNVSILPALSGGDPAPEDLLMDVYEPMGDTLTERPVVILAHRGDFLPPIVNQSPYGTRKDSSVVAFCEDFAKRGFVAISMDYRLGWNPFGSDIEIKKTVLEASYRISQDMRACVRFLRKDYVEGENMFAIDSSRIAVGAFDAAGYAAESVAHLKRIDQTLQPKFLDFSTMPPTPFVDESLLGDPYGLQQGLINIPNHVGYSSDVSATISYEGGLGDLSWIEAGDPPSIAFLHRDKFDQVGIRDVSIGVGGSIIIAEGAFPDTTIYQSQELGNQDVFINANLDDEISQIANARSGGLEGLYLFESPRIIDSMQCDPTPGTPKNFYGRNTYPWNWYDEATFGAIWDGVPGQTIPSSVFICSYNLSQGYRNEAGPARTMIDTIQAYTVPRLVLAMGLEMTSGLNEVLKDELSFKAFPNPAREQIQLTASEEMKNIQIFDLAGRELMRLHNVNQNQYLLNTSFLSKGLYIARISFDKGVLSSKIIIQE